MCPLRWGRKRALLYLQEQSLLLCLPKDEQIPLSRLQALPLLCRDSDRAYLEGKGVTPETTPRLCYCAVWDSCRTAGAEKRAGSLEVTPLALCSCRPESSPQGGTNEPAEDNLAPLSILNPLRTVAFPKAPQETQPPPWHTSARSPSATGGCGGGGTAGCPAAESGALRCRRAGGGHGGGRVPERAPGAGLGAAGGGSGALLSQAPERAPAGTEGKG